MDKKILRRSFYQLTTQLEGLRVVLEEELENKDREIARLKLQLQEIVGPKKEDKHE